MEKWLEDSLNSNVVVPTVESFIEQLADMRFKKIRNLLCHLVKVTGTAPMYQTWTAAVTIEAFRLNKIEGIYSLCGLNPHLVHYGILMQYITNTVSDPAIALATREKMLTRFAWIRNQLHSRKTDYLASMLEACRKNGVTYPWFTECFKWSPPQPSERDGIYKLALKYKYPMLVFSLLETAIPGSKVWKKYVQYILRYGCNTSIVKLLMYYPSVVDLHPRLYKRIEIKPVVLRKLIKDNAFQSIYSNLTNAEIQERYGKNAPIAVAIEQGRV